MKRGQSGLSLIVAVDKQSGMTSHDVVNRCRRIFGERRVGHTGTLDPLATGLLLVCIGPATRLDKYLTGHDKTYLVTIGFGYETETDDVCGDVTQEGPVPELLSDESFAASYVAGLIGEHRQLPPRYSAIKVNGVKAYEAARKGRDVEIAPRTISISEAEIDAVYRDHENGILCWDVKFRVSKGTYIRSIARDIGRDLGSRAHVRSLRRLSSGQLGIESAHTLEEIETMGLSAAIDPVNALGFRYALADELDRSVSTGSRLSADDLLLNDASDNPGAPVEGEIVSVVVGNTLKALYLYDADTASWKPDCVFSTGVLRPMR